MAGNAIPIWFKVVYLCFVAVLVPVYVVQYGTIQLLWFSNLALIGGSLAAWLECRRLASTALISVGLFELAWILDFLISVALGGGARLGLVDYMFDDRIPRFVRALSLYHLFLPFVLFWLTWRLGYEPRAWKLWLVPGWGILLVSYFAASPERNLNWVRGPAGGGPVELPPWVWLGLTMTVCASLWWLTHRIVERLLRRLGGSARG